MWVFQKGLQEEINAKSDTIMLLRKAISEKSEYIESLQEKLDNVKSRAEDIQAALEDGSFSDAYDAATDTEDEAEYDEY
jgi:predicted  nucleic acid-binding Zn-ribbon protein